MSFLTLNRPPILTPMRSGVVILFENCRSPEARRAEVLDCTGGLPRIWPDRLDAHFPGLDLAAFIDIEPSGSSLAWGSLELPFAETSELRLDSPCRVGAKA